VGSGFKFVEGAMGIAVGLALQAVSRMKRVVIMSIL
jgi:hypothetical protein